MKKKIVQSFQAEKSLHSHLKLETWLIDRRYLDIPSSSFFPIFVFDWQISANKLKDINRFVSMLFAYDWLYIKDYIIWVCFLSFHNSIVEESTRNHIVNVTKQCTAVKCSNEVKKRRIMHRKTNVWRDGEKKPMERNAEAEVAYGSRFLILLFGCSVIFFSSSFVVHSFLLFCVGWHVRSSIVCFLVCHIHNLKIDSTLPAQLDLMQFTCIIE